jgi:hypothetical protein
MQLHAIKFSHQLLMTALAGSTSITSRTAGSHATVALLGKIRPLASVSSATLHTRSHW